MIEKSKERTGAMFNLSEMVEHFLEEAVRLCAENLKEDEAVIGVLDDRSAIAEVRREEVVKWLNSYKVLQGLNKKEEVGVASAIIEFADARDPAVSPTSDMEITRLFNDLQSRCSSRVHPNKDQEPRGVTSLASKALWCCYPDAIPFLDNYAECALVVISRLMGLVWRGHLPRYNRFVAMWLDVYRRVESTIEDRRLDGYPYKVRVFDKILWIIGQPDLGSVPYKPEA